jgi:hypothetical protein
MKRRMRNDELLTLAKLDQIESQAWQGWRRATRPSRTVCESGLPDGQRRTLVIIRPPDPSPLWIVILLAVSRLRVRILGLLPNETVGPIELEDGENESLPPRLLALIDRLNQLIERSYPVA